MKFGSRRLILGVTSMAAACLLVAGIANGQAAPAGQRGAAAPAAGQRGAATPAAPAGAQRGTTAAAAAGQAVRMPMAEEVFKNVTSLRGIPVDEFMDTMGMFSAALTLNCIDCHVPESVGGWDKFADETPLKRTTRRMITMVNEINKTNFSGVRSVTC